MYQTLNNITTDKKSWSKLTDEEKKAFNVFFMNRLLSQDQDLVDIVNHMQKHNNIPNEHQYTFWNRNLPESRLNLKLLKKDKANVNKDLLKILSKYFSISTKEVEEYMNILNKDYIINLLKGMGYDDKQIKNLFK